LAVSIDVESLQPIPNLLTSEMLFSLFYSLLSEKSKTWNVGLAQNACRRHRRRGF